MGGAVDEIEDKCKMPAVKKVQYTIGTNVQAFDDSSKKWYDAKIIEIDAEKEEVLIHFNKWNSRYDTWLSLSSGKVREGKAVKPTGPTWVIGDRVLAKWGPANKIYPAMVSRILKNNSVEVRFYDGFKKVVKNGSLQHDVEQLYLHWDTTYVEGSKSLDCDTPILATVPSTDQVLVHEMKGVHMEHDKSKESVSSEWGNNEDVEESSSCTQEIIKDDGPPATDYQKSWGDDSKFGDAVHEELKLNEDQLPLKKGKHSDENCEKESDAKIYHAEMSSNLDTLSFQHGIPKIRLKVFRESPVGSPTTVLASTPKSSPGQIDKDDCGTEIIHNKVKNYMMFPALSSSDKSEGENVSDGAEVKFPYTALNHGRSRKSTPIHNETSENRFPIRISHLGPTATTTDESDNEPLSAKSAKLRIQSPIARDRQLDTNTMSNDKDAPRQGLNKEIDTAKDLPSPEMDSTVTLEQSNSFGSTSPHCAQECLPSANGESESELYIESETGSEAAQAAEAPFMEVECADGKLGVVKDDGNSIVLKDDEFIYEVKSASSPSVLQPVTNDLANATETAVATGVESRVDDMSALSTETVPELATERDGMFPDTSPSETLQSDVDSQQSEVGEIESEFERYTSSDSVAAKSTDSNHTDVTSLDKVKLSKRKNDTVIGSRRKAGTNSPVKGILSKQKCIWSVIGRSCVDSAVLIEKYESFERWREEKVKLGLTYPSKKEKDTKMKSVQRSSQGISNTPEKKIPQNKSRNCSAAYTSPISLVQGQVGQENGSVEKSNGDNVEEAALSRKAETDAPSEAISACNTDNCIESAPNEENGCTSNSVLENNVSSLSNSGQNKEDLKLSGTDCECEESEIREGKQVPDNSVANLRKRCRVKYTPQKQSSESDADKTSDKSIVAPGKQNSSKNTQVKHSQPEEKSSFVKTKCRVKYTPNSKFGKPVPVKRMHNVEASKINSTIDLTANKNSNNSEKKKHMTKTPGVQNKVKTGKNKDMFDKLSLVSMATQERPSLAQSTSENSIPAPSKQTVPSISLRRNDDQGSMTIANIMSIADQALKDRLLEKKVNDSRISERNDFMVLQKPPDSVDNSLDKSTPKLVKKRKSLEFIAGKLKSKQAKATLNSFSANSTETMECVQAPVGTAPPQGALRFPHPSQPDNFTNLSTMRLNDYPTLLQRNMTPGPQLTPLHGTMMRAMPVIENGRMMVPIQGQIQHLYGPPHVSTMMPYHVPPAVRTRANFVHMRQRAPFMNQFRPYPVHSNPNLRYFPQEMWQNPNAQSPFSRGSQVMSQHPRMVFDTGQYPMGYVRHPHFHAGNIEPRHHIPTFDLRNCNVAITNNFGGIQEQMNPEGKGVNFDDMLIGDLENTDYCTEIPGPSADALSRSVLEPSLTSIPEDEAKPDTSSLFVSSNNNSSNNNKSNSSNSNNNNNSNNNKNNNNINSSNSNNSNNNNNSSNNNSNNNISNSYSNSYNNSNDSNKNNNNNNSSSSNNSITNNNNNNNCNSNNDRIAPTILTTSTSSSTFSTAQTVHLPSNVSTSSHFFPAARSLVNPNITCSDLCLSEKSTSSVTPIPSNVSVQLSTATSGCMKASANVEPATKTMPHHVLDDTIFERIMVKKKKKKKKKKKHKLDLEENMGLWSKEQRVVPDKENLILRIHKGQIVRGAVKKKKSRVYESKLDALLQSSLNERLSLSDFKCTVGNCDKVFRKSSLLEYHLKYFHKNNLDQESNQNLGSSSCPIDGLTNVRVATSSTLSEYNKSNDTTPVTTPTYTMSDNVFSDSDTESSDDGEKSIDGHVKCKCQDESGLGFMIQCEQCFTWQHGRCVGYRKRKSVPLFYLCHICSFPDGLQKSQLFSNDYTWYRYGRLPPVHQHSVEAENGKDKERVEVQSNMILTTHAMMTELNNTKAILHGIRRKFLMLKNLEQPELLKWVGKENTTDETLSRIKNEIESGKMNHDCKGKIKQGITERFEDNVTKNLLSVSSTNERNCAVGRISQTKMDLSDTKDHAEGQNEVIHSILEKLVNDVSMNCDCSEPKSRLNLDGQLNNYIEEHLYPINESKIDVINSPSITDEFSNPRMNRSESGYIQNENVAHIKKETALGDILEMETTWKDMSKENLIAHYNVLKNIEEIEDQLNERLEDMHAKMNELEAEFESINKSDVKEDDFKQEFMMKDKKSLLRHLNKVKWQNIIKSEMVT